MALSRTRESRVVQGLHLGKGRGNCEQDFHLLWKNKC